MEETNRSENQTAPSTNHPQRLDNSVDSDYYNFTYPRRGLAIIISCDENDRKGVEFDKGFMAGALTKLGFESKVFVCNNKNDVMQALTTAAGWEHHGQSDCFACVVMSHGNEASYYSQTTGLERRDYIDVGEDIVAYEEILEFFHDCAIGGLRGKPRLFFFQVCRGGKCDMNGPLINVVQNSTTKIKASNNLVPPKPKGQNQINKSKGQETLGTRGGKVFVVQRGRDEEKIQPLSQIYEDYSRDQLPRGKTRSQVYHHQQKGQSNSSSMVRTRPTERQYKTRSDCHEFTAHTTCSVSNIFGLLFTGSMSVVSVCSATVGPKLFPNSSNSSLKLVSTLAIGTMITTSLVALTKCLTHSNSCQNNRISNELDTLIDEKANFSNNCPNASDTDDLNEVTTEQPKSSNVSETTETTETTSDCDHSKTDGIDVPDVPDAGGQYYNYKPDGIRVITSPAPLCKDFLVMYATPPGYYAWRDELLGSWFIVELSKALNNDDVTEGKISLLKLLTRVNARVATSQVYAAQTDDKDKDKAGSQEIPVIESMLVKDVIFKKKSSTPETYV